MDKNGGNELAHEEGEQKIKVMLVDDNAMMHTVLGRIINAQDDMQVIAEAKNGAEAVKLVQGTLPAPDVILMDVNMPIMGGIKATKEIISILPKARIIALSMHNSQVVIDEMLSAGALTYIIKSEAVGMLYDAIRSSFLEQEITKQE